MYILQPFYRMNKFLMKVVNVPVYTKNMVLKTVFIPSSEDRWPKEMLRGGCNCTLEGGGDVYRGGDSSTGGVTRLQRATLVYRGGDSYTEGKTQLRIGRLVYGGVDSSMEGEACVQRGRLVYKGATLVYRGWDSSIEGKTRLGTILDAIGNVQNGPNTVCAEHMYMNIYMYI